MMLDGKLSKKELLRLLTEKNDEKIREKRNNLNSILSTQKYRKWCYFYMLF